MPSKKVSNILKDIGIVLKKRGIIKTLRMFFVAGYLIIFQPKNTFTFNNKKYYYLYRRKTASSERTIEVPIVMMEVNKNSNKKILEIGNVLSNYYPLKWDVVDKFEKAEGVINQDVVDYVPDEKYDLIVSISTLEHVGYEGDDIKDPMKILSAIKNLIENCLKESGKIIVTLPFGYNKEMDKLFFDGKLDFDEKYYFKRVSWLNKWIQTDKEHVANSKYDYPFTDGNGILVGIINANKVEK